MASAIDVQLISTQATDQINVCRDGAGRSTDQTTDLVAFDKYTYANDDPVNMLDRDGECPAVDPCAGEGLTASMCSEELAIKYHLTNGDTNWFKVACGAKSVAGGIGGLRRTAMRRLKKSAARLVGGAVGDIVSGGCLVYLVAG